MGKDEALAFLRHMSSDPETSQRVVEEYKKLLQDLAAEKGFSFSNDELVEAAETLREMAAGELGDTAIAMVIGGSQPGTAGPVPCGATIVGAPISPPPGQ